MSSRTRSGLIYSGVEYQNPYLLFVAAATKIQRWYRRFRLVEADPPDVVTKRTLIRYYITKYSTKDLSNMPMFAIHYLKLLGHGKPMRCAWSLAMRYVAPSEADLQRPARMFKNFIRDFRITVEDLFGLGW